MASKTAKRRRRVSERRRRYPQAEPAMPGRPPDRLKIGWT